MLPQKAPRKRVAYGLPPSVKAILATASDVQGLMSDGINPDGSLKPEAVRALLKVKSISVRELAETSGYTDAYFHQVINRDRRDAVVEDVVAGVLGLEADRIWGRLRNEIAS